MNLNFPTGDTHFKPNAWAEYQLAQYQQLVKHTPRRGLAIDCGAHAGIMTRRMSRDFDQVISFEPVHHQILKANTEDLTNVDIKAFGVSDHLGELPCTINRENSGDCLIAVDGADQMPVITIDWLDLPTVDAVKMDIQGSELSALVGATKTITRDHPTLMLEIENWDPNREIILDLLKEWGYVLVFTKNADTVWRFKG